MKKILGVDREIKYQITAEECEKIILEHFKSKKGIVDWMTNPELIQITIKRK
jgi:hypothetical protein